MTTEEAFKECVATTNGIINRWLTQNNVNPSKIYTDDVRGILLGYMQKLVFKNAKADFKRFSKIITVVVNDRTKMISHVLCGINDNLYFRDKNFVASLMTIIDNTDYPSILPKVNTIDSGSINQQHVREHYYQIDKPVNDIELPHLNTKVDIDFKNVESIKF